MIQPHPTWAIQDSSKIKAFMECPRYYFYRYVLGWTSDTPKQDLVFGSAWHAAREVTMIEGFNEDSLMKAERAFLDIYRKDFDEMSDELYGAKTPGIVIPALVEYYTRYRGDQYETLFTEVAGTVGIDDTRKVAFKMDSICRGKEGIFSREHKTSKRKDSAWADQWYLDLSIGTYSHVLHMLYPNEKIYGVVIDGTFFRQKGLDFERVPVRKTPESMNTWWWTILYWLDMIDWEFERLRECSDSDGVLMAFPMRPTNCCSYYKTCEYHDFCGAWANPLQYFNEGEPPRGFRIEWWNPLEREETAKKVVHLDIAGEDETFMEIYNALREDIKMLELGFGD